MLIDLAETLDILSMGFLDHVVNDSAKSVGVSKGLLIMILH